MSTKVLAAALLAFVLGACSLAESNDVPAAASSAAVASESRDAPVRNRVSQPEGAGIPSQIRFASPLGDVVFQHEMHFKDRGIACVQCHHQINAKKLDTPHPDYLKSSTVNCQICHKESEQTVYSCTGCHDGRRRDIADETLSAKVVIHKQCQACHSVGTGRDASNACLLCHAPGKS
jgi:hypothetical protein